MVSSNPFSQVNASLSSGFLGELGLSLDPFANNGNASNAIVKKTMIFFIVYLLCVNSVYDGWSGP
jgi:hypothetical protein